MGKPKSSLKRVFVDAAKSSHKCRRNKDHHIGKGVARLNIKEGRSIYRYCLECGKISIENDIKNLTTILGEIEKVKEKS